MKVQKNRKMPEKSVQKYHCLRRTRLETVQRGIIQSSTFYCILSTAEYSLS